MLDILITIILFGSAGLFIACCAIMGYVVISCRLPSGCPTPAPTQHPDQYIGQRSLTDENYL